MPGANPNAHEYAAHLVWEGDPKTGTVDYASYSRRYRVEIEGKPTLVATAAEMFKGDPSLHDPENHFLAAIAGCHMLSYLALCAKHGVRVLAYEDSTSGTLELSGGSGKFSGVTLRPTVTISDAKDVEKAKALHDNAHHVCFIANSCSVPIAHEATIVVK